jgi:1-acyl-sn-glycerol-3-phosphate acyltransferase
MKDFFLNGFRLLAALVSDVFWHVFFTPKAVGSGNIPKKGGVIVACNHLSHFDPMFVGYHVLNSFGRFSSRQIWSPAKEELFQIPVLGFLIRMLRSFPIKRGKADLKSLGKITELAKEHLVIIYPEGTRSPDGTLGRGKSAIGKIVFDSRATVVPAAIFNTQYCLPKGSRKPRFFLPLSVVFGKPLNLSKYLQMPDCKETSKAITDEIMRAIAELQKEHAHLDISTKGSARVCETN